MYPKTSLPLVGVCALCSGLFTAQPAFAGPITEITGRYATITPAQGQDPALGVTNFTLGGGIVDPFGSLAQGAQTLDQSLDITANPSVTFVAITPVFNVNLVFAAAYWDIINPGTLTANDPLKVVTITVPLVLDPSTLSPWQGNDISAISDAELIYTLTATTDPPGTGITYNPNDPNFSITFRVVPRSSVVPEPSALALTMSGLISLAAVGWVKRRRLRAFRHLAS